MIKGQLTDTDRTEIVKYRIEKAYRTYQEAVGSIKNGYVETAANRLYYAAYYAVSALLISYKYEASTHNVWKSLLVEPAKELIDLVSEMAKKQLM